VKSQLPAIVITGASGFIGRNFIEITKDRYKIYAIARRSPKEAGVAFHQNIQWIQCDIANWASLDKAMEKIKQQGGADFVLHLAAFYDFDYKDNPEYERSNITGTANILRLAENIGIKRFIFSSSLAACNFPKPGTSVTEKSPPDANFAYALSKKRGEEMVREASKKFSCSVVRLAAVFSDWCEYAPLYKFLTTWVAKKWDSKIIAGKGESGVTYIHIHDLVELFNTIINKTNSLPDFDVYNASPDGSTSHRELFEIATRYYFGKAIKPFFIPKAIAFLGVLMRSTLRDINIAFRDSFERLWMIKYIDLKLKVDSLYSRQALSWKPRPRYHILRRLLFLMEKMKSHPVEWHVRNEAALKKVTRRANLMIYESLVGEKDKLMKQIQDHILSPERELFFSRFQKMGLIEFQHYMDNLLSLLLTAVRSGDRSLMLNNIADSVMPKFTAGFNATEVCDSISAISELVFLHLLSKEELKAIRQEIYDYIGMTTQLAKDEVEDLFETFAKST